MAIKKKSVQKQIKDVVVPTEGTETNEVETMTTLFVFKAKFGNVIFSSPVKDCDADTMRHLVEDYKKTHDLKDLTTVAVAPFIKWITEDRGFKLANESQEDILWV